MENVIYIGTTIAAEGLKQNQLYTRRPNEFIKKLSEKYPMIHLLFVSVKKLGKAQAEVQKIGSALNLANEQVRKGEK